MKHKQIPSTPNPQLQPKSDTGTRPMFCPECFAEHEKEIPLLQGRDTNTGEKYWICPRCKEVID